MKEYNKITAFIAGCGLLFGANGAVAGDNSLNSRLSEAAKRGNAREVQQLLAAGADVNAPGCLKLTALHYAAGREPRGLIAYQGHVDGARLLIDAGADVDARDFLEQTPLHYAVEARWGCVARLLIKRGADVTAKNRGGKTPLDECLDSCLREQLLAAKRKRLAANHERLEAIGQWILRLEDELPADVVRCEILPALPEMECERGVAGCAVLRCAALQQVCGVACDGRNATPLSSDTGPEQLVKMVRLLRAHPNVQFEFAAGNGPFPLLRGLFNGHTLQLQSPDGETRIEFSLGALASI